MNDKRMQIYLDDHLALMVAETELAERCRSSNQGTPLAQFLQRLEKDVQAQKSTGYDVLYRVGGENTMEARLKRGAAWFAEKLGRLKLNDSLLSYSDLSRLVELEALIAAAEARMSLWDSFQTVAGIDSRLAGIHFGELRDQSQTHRETLSTHRRAAALAAFTHH